MVTPFKTVQKTWIKIQYNVTYTFSNNAWSKISKFRNKKFLTAKLRKVSVNNGTETINFVRF